MTTSSAAGDSSATTATAKPAEAEAKPSTPQDDSSKKTTSENPGYKKSASVLKRRIEEGNPNQALTLFTPISVAEDLTKIQLTLCNEIKAELQAVKEAVTAFC